MTTQPTLPPRTADAIPPLEGGEVVSLPSARGLAGGFLSAVARPRAFAQETVRLGQDLAAIARGTDDFTPAEKDKRFADPAWQSHPGYRRLAQTYTAWGSSLTRLVDGYAEDGADWRDVERARFALNALISGMAPTNTLLGNPAAVKKAFDTGGRSLVRGARQLVGDVLHNGGLPQTTDREAYQVGRNLGVTKGSVVYRDEVVEVIQYAPRTAQVRERPLVVVPPPIGRYYFLDLRPGRSFVEHAVDQGLTVFMISWRNPTRKQAGWNLDTYAESVRRAVGVAREITGSPDVNALGFCAGGIILTTLLNHLAAISDRSVHSAAYAVTLLDFGGRAPLGAFSGRGMVGTARRLSRTRGVISARSMGSMFAWMRPDDLIFNYLVSQWLMGEAPPAFDILAWNADGTNLPAALHEQFLQIFRDNALVRPGALTVLGTPVDLASIDVPTFVTGALTDHITPWTGTYRTTQLLAGPTTFVLSSSGHIQSLVNPRATRGRPTGPVASPDPTRRTGTPRPRSTPAAGGSTGPRGRRSAPANSSTPRRRRAATSTRRCARHLART
ncbi:PHA/PHB synthase family protein [Blastococcus sp. PRF04-17]|uniref:PHA/PHB synthase family protein n=1 Tax=Blastococcus sp. PRF04-17 TaxID=2933797 RepID=UPI001FF35B9D|nr:alpha/beta fold hydrolase [Blastococcus sp. PRF04-17]UOY01913.1 alpha/beta fold hydrolase [Blastococcus sp. PRF04-17]